MTSIRPVSRNQLSGFLTGVSLPPTEHSVLSNILKMANNAHGVRILPLVSWTAHIKTSLSVTLEAGWRSTHLTRPTCGCTETRERPRCQTNEHLLVPLFQTDEMGHSPLEIIIRRLTAHTPQKPRVHKQRGMMQSPTSVAVAFAYLTSWRYGLGSAQEAPTLCVRSGAGSLNIDCCAPCPCFHSAFTWIFSPDGTSTTTERKGLYPRLSDHITRSHPSCTIQIS